MDYRNLSPQERENLLKKITEELCILQKLVDEMKDQTPHTPMYHHVLTAQAATRRRYNAVRYPDNDII